MKSRLKLLIFSFVLIFAGCEKDAVVVDAELEGSWEMGRNTPAKSFTRIQDMKDPAISRSPAIR
jgi:hypothetical protein